MVGRAQTYKFKVTKHYPYAMKPYVWTPNFLNLSHMFIGASVTKLNILWTLNVSVYCSSAKSESEGLLPDYRNDVKGLNWERRQIKFAACTTKYFQGASLSH